MFSFSSLFLCTTSTRTTTACWYCPQAPCGWQLFFQLLLPWLLLLTLCMPHARASGHNSIFAQVAFLPYEEDGMGILGFCTEPSLQLKNQNHQEEEDRSNRVLLNGSSDVCSCHASEFLPLSIQTSWNCVEKGRVCAHGLDSSEEASECLCFQACSSTKWNVTTGTELVFATVSPSLSNIKLLLAHTVCKY